MCELSQWEIWYADVPYSDNPNISEDRPVLIISPDEILVLKMTSHQDSDKPRPFEYEIMRWKEAGLSKRTFVQCDRFIRLPKERFRQKIGRMLAVDIAGTESMMHFHGLSF